MVTIFARVAGSFSHINPRLAGQHRDAGRGPSLPHAAGAGRPAAPVIPSSPPRRVSRVGWVREGSQGFTSPRPLPPRRTNLGSSSSRRQILPMQILHPFIGSVQQYLEQLADPDQPRPAHGPQCQAKQPLTAHGFYTRTLIDTALDGSIRVRRYLCQAGRRTVSLLPEFALPYLRSSVTVIALLLIARLLPAQTLAAALPPSSPYQRGQFWLRRCRAQAEALCAALAALTKPAPAPDFVHRALT